MNKEKLSHTDADKMIAAYCLKQPEIKPSKKDPNIKFGTLDTELRIKNPDGSTQYRSDEYVWEGPAMKTVRGITRKDKNNKTTWYMLFKIDPTNPEHVKYRQMQRMRTMRVGQWLDKYRKDENSESKFEGMPIMKKGGDGNFTHKFDTFENCIEMIQPFLMEQDQSKKMVPLDKECLQYALLKRYSWQGKEIMAPLLFSVPEHKYNPNNPHPLIKGLNPNTTKDPKTGGKVFVFNIPWERVHGMAITVKPLFEDERIHFKPKSADLFLPKSQIISMVLINVEEASMNSQQEDALMASMGNVDSLFDAFDGISKNQPEGGGHVGGMMPSMPPGMTLPTSVNTTATTADLAQKLALANGPAPPVLNLAAGVTLDTAMSAPMPKANPQPVASTNPALPSL